VDRSPLFLAALASAAVPGLDPASVEALPSEPGQLFDVAFVQDTQHRRWVVRAPRTQAAGAQMDLTVALLGLLARRLPFGVPTPKGFAALKDGGRAAIYPYLAGQNLDFSRLPVGPGLAAELGRAIAALHNADHALFEEAGLPVYDADTHRTRRLSELDRAAGTGHVPTGLLARWEKALEDVALWRFAPTPTHGDLTGDQVLAVFDDQDDASSGRVSAFTGWEDAKVADPADDFFALATQAPPAALETLMEAYAHTRAERPDANLLVRARLSAEMRQLSELMGAVAVGDRVLTERLASGLRRLDEQVHAEDESDNDYHHTSLSPARPAARVLVPPAVVEDEADDPDDDVEEMFARTAPDEPDPEDVDAPASAAAAEDLAPEDGGAADAEPEDTEPEGVVTEDVVPEDIPAEPADTEPGDAEPKDAEPEDAVAEDVVAEDVVPQGADHVDHVDAVKEERTEEIDVSSLRGSHPVDGPDPGPDFEPGYRP
jgi:macrolide phosphotransferase